MKKYLLIYCFTFFLAKSYSQIIITSQQVIQPNVDIYRTILDTTGFSYGNPGSNIQWDYSSINIIQYNSAHYQYLPTSTTFCFIDSTINMYLNGGYILPSYRYNYYIADSTQFGFKGFCQYDPPWNSGQFTFSDYQIYMTMPFNYLDSFSDSSFGIMQGGAPLTIHEMTGSISNLYDGWGELKLPWGTYPNVARVKVVNYNKDSIYNSGDVRIGIGIGYDWYDLNTHGAILSYGEGTSTFIPFGGTPTVTYYKGVSAQANSPLSINEILFPTAIKIFPNPTLGKFTIGFSDLIINGQIQILNLIGEVVLEKSLFSTYKEEINLENISTGIYFVKIFSEDKIYCKKLIVEQN